MALASVCQRGLPQWRRIAIAFSLAAFAARWAAAAPPAQGWSAKAATAIVESRSSASGGWDTETGLRLLALEAEWYNTAHGEYFDYARKVVDGVLADPGWNASPRAPYGEALLGEQLMLLYRVTQKHEYYDAARELRDRLAPSCGLGPDSADAPPEVSGGCAAQAFLADYAAEFQRPQDFPVLARSFAAPVEAAAVRRDAGNRWLQFAIAWRAASLVDSIAYYPEGGPARAQALAALHRTAAQRLRAGADADVSPAAGWLLTYALLKGARLHELPAPDRDVAMRIWRRQLATAHVDSAQQIAFGGSGDDAGLGAFLLASTEVDLAPGSSAGRGAEVLLDAWYNSQQRKNAAGLTESFHYKWNDLSDSGYSIFGHLLRSAGLRTETLASAPTAKNLASAAYYLIVSPDIPVKNPQPHYMTSADADGIAAWVRRGGVLILMENDPPNADVEHLDLLADRFGIHFDDVLHHHVVSDHVRGDHVEDGRIAVAAGGPLFLRPHTLYMKDTCAITLHGEATALLRDRGDVVMATAHYGRGLVFAAVDPWLYNEYTDGRKKPAATYRQFDNFAGGEELVRWLIQQRQPARASEAQKGKQ